MEILASAVPILLIALTIEAVYCYKSNIDGYDVKDAAINVGLGLGMTFLGGLNILSQFTVYAFVYHYFHFFNIEDKLWLWIVTYILYDFCLYWSHRYSHKIRFMWASHIVHHSSNKFNLSTASRQPLTESLFEILFAIWMPLLGFKPEVLIACHSINLIYQYFLHTETINKLPQWYEFVLNTPSHHRVHHGRDIKYIDKNFGCTLIVWDRIFDTFQIEEERPNYGISYPLNTYNPVKILFHEWWDMIQDLLFRAKGSKSLFLYVFGPPGWNKENNAKNPISKNYKNI